MKVVRFFMKLISYTLLLGIVAFVILFALTSTGIIDNPYENKPEFLNLSQSEIRLKRNDSFQLNAKVLPDKARNRKVLYKSDKPDIVSVNEITGYLEAKKNGVATITAYLEKNNNIKSECMVIVSNNNIEITGISLNTKKIDLIIGKTFQLNFKLKPKEATLHEIEYMTSDPKVATVNDKGLIEAKGIGTCNIVVSEKITGIFSDVLVTVHDKETIVEPEKLELTPKDIKIIVGGSQKIKANIKPSNAVNDITWESLDDSVAVVSNNGLVTGKKIGRTQIVGTTVNGLEAYVKVDVIDKTSTNIIKVTGIKLSSHDITLFIDETKDINYDIVPSNATNQGVNINSSNTNVVTINGSKIKAVGQGTATITVETKDGGYRDTMKVTVKKVDNVIKETDIELSIKDIVVDVNGTKKVEAKVVPSNATYKTITWESSNPNVAIVKDGLITGRSKGTTEITVKSKNITKKIRVVVNEVLVQSISLNKTSATLNVSDTLSLVKTISPNNATNKSVSWTSSNNKIATVNSNGVVKAISPGETIITVKTSNNLEATCKVTVKKSTTPVSSYKVTFNPNGGSVTPTTKTVNNGSNFGDLPTPVRSNYTFTGWYTSKDGGSEIKSSTIVNINNDIILYAHWKSSSVPVTGISLNKTSITLNVGGSETITATITPSNATNQSLTWTSSDSKIASVSSSGKITAVKEGTVTITVKTTNNLTATCKVTVKASSGAPTVSPILSDGTINNTYFGIKKGDKVSKEVAGNNRENINKAISYAADKNITNIKLEKGIYVIHVFAGNKESTNVYATRTGIKMKSNIHLNLNGSTIKMYTKKYTKADPVNIYPRYRVFHIENLSNVSITNGTIIGDRDYHTCIDGTPIMNLSVLQICDKPNGTGDPNQKNHQLGFGIGIVNSKNIKLTKLNISMMVGDAIYIRDNSSNITITDNTLHNCRRQGISILSGHDITIKNNNIHDIKGSNPGAGIDLEPGASDDRIYNITIDDNNISKTTKAISIGVCPTFYNSKKDSKITITNNTLGNNIKTCSTINNQIIKNNTFNNGAKLDISSDGDHCIAWPNFCK